MHTRDLFDISGAVAIVTGGTTGLGRQMATALAEMGADIVVASLDQALCDQVADEFRAMGRRALGIEFDLGSVDSIRATVGRVMAEFGQIDILVNCAAAVGVTSPYEPVTPEAWDTTLRINVSGTFWCSQEVARVMKTQRRGKIINIGSAYGVVGVDPSLYLRSDKDHFEHFAYCTTKGAVINLTRDMAANLARWNINVNSISPGMFPSPAVFKKYGTEVFDRLRQRTPLGRTGGEDDLKGAVVFLASPASDFVTGHNLVVDGGWLAW
ncbi:MAG: SDR family oxidoreductase [Chloroflexi bacterium]|nr:SDR family oxidoreductase [Chloroflexota bacterium]